MGRFCTLEAASSIYVPSHSITVVNVHTTIGAGVIMIDPRGDLEWEELCKLHDEDEDAANESWQLAYKLGECLFGNDCCMPDPYHLPSECHTAEMMEQYYQDCAKL